MSLFRSAASQVRKVLASIAKDVIHIPERVLHGRRRTAARQALANGGPVRSAVFICHGNVCRSPFAAAVFQRSATQAFGAPLVVTSSGFIGPDRSPPELAIAAAARRNYDTTAHKSKLITFNELNEVDLIVVMSAEQATALRQRFGTLRRPVLILGDLDPLPITRRTIRDPWGTDESVFDDSFARVERCVLEMTQVLSATARGRSGH